VKTFIEALPPSLEESATLDGAGYTRVFFSIVMPLITPILATLCIFSAVGQWNSFTDTMMLMPSGKFYTLQFLLYKYQNEASSLAALVRNTQDSSALANVATKQTALSVRMTVAMVVTIPILLVYPFFQRYFVKGIMIGAVKG
jgi:putative aldouronate transport system permease protein